MRMIDADAFERSVMCSDAEDMQDVIYALREFPTAYDPDKVVEQLEELKRRYGIEEFAIKGIICKAIEIVKGGGVDAKTDS